MMTAFLFPGQGSQSPGMGADISSTPEAGDLFGRADRILGFGLTKIFLHGPEEELRLTANAQPALVAVGVACATLVAARGREPSFVAGHSLGEYTALVIAGALSFEDAVQAVHKRGRYMQEAVPVGRGAMAALMGIELAPALDLCREISSRGEELVQVANDNAPGQIVVAGHAAAVEVAMAEAKMRGARRAVRLPVSAPFHCDLMKPAAERLAEDLRATSFGDLRVPLVTNVDAREIRTGAEAREALTRQVTARVRWTESVRRLEELGAGAAVECGPGQVLAGLVKRISPSLPVIAAGDLPGIDRAAKQAAEGGARA